ncbi:MAG: molybdenum cofactor guanylyltransferase [Acidimicrobiales bacterium]
MTGTGRRLPAHPAGPRAGLAGILLTGGSSRRMGHDKAALLVDGEPLAERTARLLELVALPVLEVGPGWTTLDATCEDPPGGGPLAAVAAGAAALRERGHEGPALVVACDLPLLSAELLDALARRPGDDSVLPVVGGRHQPLCARWSAADLGEASARLGRGERSLLHLPDRNRSELLDETSWPPGLDVGQLADVDTPDDLERLAVDWRPGRPRPAVGPS